MPRRNLIPHPSFEIAANLTDWTATASGIGTRSIQREQSGTGSNGTITPPSGSYYGFVRRAEASSGGTGNLQAYTGQVPVTPGVSYAGSVSINRDGTTALRCDIDWHNSAGTYLSSASGTATTPADDTWARIGVVGVAPAGAAFAKVFVVALAQPWNLYIRFDGAMLEPEVSSIGTYRDGSSTGWAWSGAAHQSYSYEVELRSGQGVAGPLGVSARSGPGLKGRGRTNLMPNGSFEVGVTGWSTSGVRSGVTATAPARGTGTVEAAPGAGSAYGFVNITGDGASAAGTSDATLASPIMAAAAGASYTVSFAVRASAATMRYRATFQFRNAAGSSTSHSTYITEGPATTEWVRRTFTATAPAGTVDMRLYLYIVGEASTSVRSFRLDGVIVESTPTYDAAVPYFDGDTEGASWESAAHASRSTLLVPAVTSRPGQGEAGPLGLSAFAYGTRLAVGSGAARHGLAAAGAGTARRQSLGAARVGLAGMAAGVKRGIGNGWAPPIGATTRGAGPKVGIGAGRWDLGLAGYATAPTPVPLFNGRPLAEEPLPLAQARYLVQNILTGRWLHTDLPLTDDTTKVTLSGPCEIAGKIVPEYADLRVDGGGPLLRSWGHVVYLELDGEIRGAGLITEDSYDDQTQTLVCQGVSAYPQHTSYQGNYRRYFADPLTVVQEMWGYVQSFPNGNLGVQVTRSGGTPPVLWGAKVNPVPGDTLLGLKYAERPAGTDNDQDPPTLPVAYANTLPAVWSRLLAMGYRGKPDDKQEALYVRKADLERAYTDYFLTPGQPHGLTLANPPDRTSSVTIEPHKVDWWDVKMVGELVDEGVKALPADYVEQYAWNIPHTFVDQRVMLAYPRVGRRREDLRFVQGENIVQPLRLDADPDGFATCVIGIGAGEGSEALRETAEVILPGVARKTYVYRNTKITDRTTLARIVRDELLQRSTGGHDIPSIVVQASHVNAVFGAYSVGDDILVQGEVPHYGWIALWCRVLSMTLARGADLVEIALRRSDSFYYGREVEST